MLIYAGIDEAGYGPMLGPLCLGCCAFILEQYDPAEGAPNLWDVLSEAVCRDKRDSRKRIVIDDSKKLKGAKTVKGAHPLRHLERGVLSMLPVDALPTEDAGLFTSLGVDEPHQAWYASTTTLPVGQSAEQLMIDASRVRRAMAETGVSIGLMQGIAINEEAFNLAVERMGNKASVNFTAAMRLVDAVWSRWADRHPRVVVDRQGGRTHYLRDLQMTFPDAQLRIIAESNEISRYQVSRGDSMMTISFARGSEDRHLPVALASMIAKYVRELMMIRLNRFFTEHVPELKPTAGYVQDARRYLGDIDSVIRALSIPKGSLIRSV